MKLLFSRICIIAGLLLTLSACRMVNSMNNAAEYNQYGTIGGLLEGRYDGNETVKNLARDADFGIGTFNQLNGELVMWQGEVWQVLADTTRGVVRRCLPNDSIPYSISCHFHADTTFRLASVLSFSDLESQLDSIIKRKGVPVAIQVCGNFFDVETRSVAPQQKPYKRLSEAVKQQALFSFKNTSGVMVGFYTPSALKEIAVAGYHFHYLSYSKKQGGHLLNCSASNVEVSLCWLHQFRVQFPLTQAPILSASQTETQLIEKR